MSDDQTRLDIGASDKEIRIAITDARVRKDIALWSGIKYSLRVLQEQKLGKELAGMALAQLILRQEADELHLQFLRRTMRLLARAGVDLSAWSIHRFEDLETIVCTPIVDVLTDDGAAKDGL